MITRSQAHAPKSFTGTVAEYRRQDAGAALETVR